MHLWTVQQNAGCYHQTGPSMRPERLQPPMAPSLPRPFTNGVPHMQTPAAFDVCTPSRTIDCLSDALNVQNSNSIGLMHGLNGGIVKSESGYPSDPQIFYDGDPNLGEAHGSMEDASFNGMEASSQPLNETLLGVNGSYGQLGHIPKLFSLPDLAYSSMMILLYTHFNYFHLDYVEMLVTWLIVFRRGCYWPMCLIGHHLLYCTI